MFNQFPDVNALFSSDTANSPTIRRVSTDDPDPQTNESDCVPAKTLGDLRELLVDSQLQASAKFETMSSQFETLSKMKQDSEDLRVTIAEQHRSTRHCIKAFQTWTRIDSEQARMLHIEASDRALSVSQAILRCLRRMEEFDREAFKTQETNTLKTNRCVFYTGVICCVFNVLLLSVLVASQK